MNILAIGASKNIGYYAYDANCNVTFLLRSPSVFDSDITIQPYIKSGKAHLVKGDALVESDVKRAWDEALTHGAVDLLLFTLGGKPTTFSITKGAGILPINLVTQCLLNTLCTMPKQSPQPRIIALSSTAHASIPLLLKPAYGYLGKIPHTDKQGAECAIAFCAGWKWEKDGPGDEIMGERWMEREGLPDAGSLKEVLVIKPGLLTDGDCRADSKKNAYRVTGVEDGGWTISRKDVAHFVADVALNRWNEFSGKTVNVSY
ncbi:hypothetical protein BT96DRAFT_966590 [Gymnopus androsaceus JB14]|uniref:NAD(P)-binding domain-containing protein n=1 Tax=Gymnopus androsaceus JB14 TaxID=1447944 RepID=A0A6A4HG66_9AGAR|nr:hypothetical protein BT96DRAFT_966590 [Gymnopus androsaceus JB14]